MRLYDNKRIRNHMKSKPVRKYASPKHPTRLQAQDFLNWLQAQGAIYVPSPYA
jgi:hypothetical protein